MAKGISEDAQVHISVAFLIKAMLGVGILVGSWYQAQNKFAEHDRRIKYLENKVNVLEASVQGIETSNIQKLEEENRTLMQKLGLKK